MASCMVKDDGEGTYFMIEDNTKAEDMPFASGFVCLEFIVTGNNTTWVGEWLDWANTT